MSQKLNIRKLTGYLKTGIIHPYLFVIFFILYNIWQLDNYVTFQEWFSSSLALLAGVFVIFFLFKLILKNSIRSGMATAFVVIAFLFYSDVYYAILGIGLPTWLIRHRYLVGFILLLAVMLIYNLRSSKLEFVKFNYYLNILTILLLLFEFGRVQNNNISGREWQGFITLNDKRGSEISVAENNGPSVKPDVYLILLDGYTNSKSLARYWGYDNSVFLNKLSEKGFYLVNDAQSNYGETLYSMASMLNMDFLKDFRNIEDEIVKNTICRVWIKDNEVVKRFRSYGYAFENYSLFDIADNKYYLDYDYLMLHGLSFYSHIYKKTIIGRITADTYFTAFNPKTGEKILRLAGNASKRQSVKPVFVYAHVTIPHLPYYYDREGNTYPDGKGKFPDSPEKSYLEQLIYTNDLTLSTVNRILDNSGRTSIIILQGDHGYRKLKDEQEGAKEAFTTFSAIYLPSGDYTSLKKSVTPVNVFRIIFNQYFGETNELLEDRVNYWKANN